MHQWQGGCFMLFIGIDLGTSAVKLLLMNENGKILKTVSREYPLFFPHPGWSEQNPDTWLESTLRDFASCLKMPIRAMSAA